MKLVFDIEANGLLPTVSKFHCAGAMDVDTGDEYWFKPTEFKSLLELLDKADTIIAHNAFGYDIPALDILSNTLLGVGWKPKANVQCTKVMSQLLNYRRFGFGHSLKQWGQAFGDQKGDYSGGWEEYNHDMFVYMQQDVRLGTRVYKALMQEVKNYVEASGSKSILRALRSEMRMDAIMVEQGQNGWKFNKEEALSLTKEIEERMKVTEEFINPKLPLRIKRTDGNEKTKKPTFTKAGKPHSWMRNWFQLGDECAVDDCPIWGEFSRIEFIVSDVGSLDSVKRLLYTLGWVPDEWNWKKVNGQFIKTGPKLTDSSLERLGDVGKALMEYYTLRSRLSIIKGWFDYIDEDSRLHGDVFNIGTPTFRQTHKIIANLPSGKAAYGKEIRELFIAKEGYTLVSADSAGCQLRLLAHYMGDPSYTKEVLEGDIHQKNADILGSSRADAKPFIFAYLYGAGGKKLGSILGVSDAQGNKLKKKFTAAFPALDKLINKVESISETSGFIPGLDDRPIYVDSKHKALNYLIQGAEAVVMKSTVIMIDEKLKEANIDFSHLLFYHDEHTVEVREDQAEQAREIIMECFREAPKQYGVNIMDCGDCIIGDNFYAVH